MCLIHNEICHPEIRKIWEKQVQFIKISCFFQGKDKLDFFFCLLLFTNQSICRCSTHRSLIGAEKQTRVQWVTRTENLFRWEQYLLDGKAWLGQNPSPFSRNPWGTQPQQLWDAVPNPWGMGTVISWQQKHFLYIHSFLFSVWPRWNNYNMACKLQHHKTWHWNYFEIGSVNRWSGALKKRTIWSVKVQWQILCLGTMGIL